MAEAPATHLVVATVRKPHGVRGEMKLALETDRPDTVFRPGRALRIGDAAGRPTDATLTIEKVRPIEGGLLLKAAEHQGLTPEVEGLRGKTLLIPREEAALPAADEVPYHALIGLTVLVSGEPVGTVRGVLEAGGGEMLAVQRLRGKELLVPFVKEIVRDVDLERRVLVVEPPDGLLDL